jgi:hypothetical protein
MESENRNKDPLLNLDEFGDRFTQGGGNFAQHFDRREEYRWMTGGFRAKPVYRRCAEAYPIELEELQKKLEPFAGKKEISEKHLELLYEAYKLMHPYADSDDELFQ